MGHFSVETLDLPGSALSGNQQTSGNRSVQISDCVLSGLQALTVLIGAVLLLRSRGRLSVALLGSSLACLNFAGNAPIWVRSSPVLFGVTFALGDLINALSPLLMIGFALSFRFETEGPPRALTLTGFKIFAAVSLGWALLAEGLVQTGRLTPTSVMLPVDQTPASWASLVLADLGFALAVLVLIAGWRRAPALEWPRYRYMVPALALVTMMEILQPLPGIWGGWDPTENPVVLAMSLLPLLGLSLLSYAVLRHRVVDLGFAVNRTLVYGVVSAMLLAVFGLTEWAVDHFLPFEGRETNALVDAAVALGIFLTFHHVFDFVKEAVERLFFHGWHHAEAQLRRFLHESAFFTSPEALAEGGVEALSRYAGGAPCAFYIVASGGDKRAAGDVVGLAADLPMDLGPLVALRADPKPGEWSDPSLPASVLAPMLHRNAVIGFVALGAKPSGERFRPDEIDLIGSAASRIGQDLHALKVERLESDASDLRRENATLRSLVPHLGGLEGLAAGIPKA